VNILSMLTQTHDDRSVTLLLTIEVESVEQLSRTMHRLENLRDVVEVRRDTAAGLTPIDRARAS
jgi:GTP pyrophosphokinase